jgi:hypothetical protein
VEVLTSVVWFTVGVLLIVLVVDSALRTFVLPRAAGTMLTRAVFLGLRGIFKSLTRWCRTYEARDRVMALYAPIGLLVLPTTWLVIVLFAYTAMFHALDVAPWERAFEMSGSSLLTLGFVAPGDLATNLLAFVEAATGLGLLALLISYLPTIYGAFSRREALVAQLAVRSSDPPSGVTILARAEAMERFDLLDDLWVPWQAWFSEVEETHTSLGVLSFFRSPRAHRSWITAAGAVLDAASLRLAVVDLPYAPQAGLCVRSGAFATQAIADYFGITFDPDPRPTDPVSISRVEFDDACQRLEAAGIPLVADRDQAWRDFAGWRVNYDRPVVGIAGLVMAPYAPWSSDRSLSDRQPSLRHP